MASQVTDISFVQLPINILEDRIDNDMQKLVLDKNINVVAYNVLANGLLSGKYGPDVRFPANDRRSRLPLFRVMHFSWRCSGSTKLRLRQSLQV